MVKFALPARPEAVGLARAFVRDALSDILPLSRLADVVLLTSELLTNAIQHAHLEQIDPVDLQIDVGARSVRVAVVDAGAGFDFDKIRRQPPGDEGGYGLFLVEILAARWGIDDSEPHSVWFEVDR